MLFNPPLSCKKAHDIPVRVLALIGDAVFELYERERQLNMVLSAHEMHKRVSSRVNAHNQADLLSRIKDMLTESELALLRQARNLRSSGFHKGGQAVLRLATAFEALIGYLYLTDLDRLRHVLELTVQPDRDS